MYGVLLALARENSVSQKYSVAMPLLFGGALRRSLHTILFLDFQETHHMLLALQLARELAGIKLQCPVNLSSEMIIEAGVLAS